MDPDLARSAWPCMKRFLLGGPQCDASCKACQKDGGRGDEPSRARARAKLASIVASNGLEIDVHKECTRRVSAPAHEARRQPTPPRTRAAAWDWARREGRRRRT